MGYHSRHWDWSNDFCHKHSGFKLPCKWCIASNDPELIIDEEEPLIVEQERDLSQLLENPGQLFGLKPDHYDELQAWI